MTGAEQKLVGAAVKAIRQAREKLGNEYEVIHIFFPFMSASRVLLVLMLYSQMLSMQSGVLVHAKPSGSSAPWASLNTLRTHAEKKQAKHAPPSKPGEQTVSKVNELTSAQLTELVNSSKLSINGSLTVVGTGPSVTVLAEIGETESDIDIKTKAVSWSRILIEGSAGKVITVKTLFSQPGKGARFVLLDKKLLEEQVRGALTLQQLLADITLVSVFGAPVVQGNTSPSISHVDSKAESMIPKAPSLVSAITVQDSARIPSELAASAHSNSTSVLPIKQEPQLTVINRDVQLDNAVTKSEFQRSGKNYALLIATNDYQDPHFVNLTNPILDARSLAEELQKSYGWNSRVVENPTKIQLREILREYAVKKYNPHDQLFIFFAGHGLYDDVFNMAYLVIKDSKSSDIERDTYMSSSELIGIIDRIQCSHILVSLDVCHSGAFDDYFANSYASTSRGSEQYPKMPISDLMERKMKFRTRKMLTSSGIESVSDGVPNRHSPFAAKLLEALRGYGGPDGYYNFGDLVKCVERIKPGPRAVEFGSNEPGSDFFFVNPSAYAK